MDILLTSFNVVYPMIIMMCFGIIIRKLKMVSDSGIKEMNGLIYKFFFPIMLYSNIMKSDTKEHFDLSLILYVLSLITVIYLILILIVTKSVKENSQRGVMVQGIFRSNFLVFGMSIITSLYGEKRLAPAVLLATVVVPYMNALSVIVLEIFRGNKPNPKKILIGVLKNPIIDFSILAILMKTVGLNPFSSAINSISSISTPFALVVIGASIKFENFKKYKKILTWGVAGKLIFVPAIAVSISAILGYRNEILVSIMCIFGGPCAAASSAMAQQMDGDGDLATLLVMTTSIFCILTFFIWIALLKTLRLA